MFPSAWLYRIANNEIKLYYRNPHSRTDSFDRMLERSDTEPMADYILEEELIQAQEELARHDQFLFFQQKIKELPLKYQEVLSLRYFEQKSVRDNGHILGKSDGTVKLLLHRGIEKLKKYV
ncbi:sigma-70 family RNA polymerase sigma factor [Paenibacillus alkaliterrae]|uniref:RNA polymerase sigma factor n=1 Tax=Paenibacillus alkaliterrae TaxID=320909 RepID=UPI001F2B0ACB|nr:sigma-70 family RNA polymerase sigma factor [Paenibacillus alkaliterrae]MCF2941881.1 sigma-70 family RNA polymerase sigma factor [Paenibacillus alkaliterrae]